MKKLMIKSIGFLLNALSYFAPKLASKLAIKLFASPQKGRLTETQIPLLESAFFEELQFDSLPIAVYRWPGKNSAILLLHGWESNASRWHYLIKELKKQGHTVIAIDAPAHGKSGSREFNALLYAEFINVVAKKYQPEIIIGHSAGGMAAVFSQHKYANNAIKKMILLGAPAHFEGVFERYVKLLSYNKRIAQGMNQFVIAHYHHPISFYSAAKFAKTLNCEALIIHDKLDDVIPYDDAAMLHESFQNSTLITTQGLGHGLKQDEVTQAILQFINH